MTHDEELQKRVLDELRWDPKVQSNEVGVIAQDGAVTLTGEVYTYAEKLAAERAAQRVKGVRAVAADIRVKIPSRMAASDEDIAKRIARLLKWNSMLQSTNIQAKVASGYVTLTGDVDWEYQRREAARRIEELNGVTGISNQVKVRVPSIPVSSKDIEKEIRRALHRHANVEASRVHISVANGTVTLDGTVDALFERELIESAAWASAGVREVTDHLRVV
jgi:osmotically-inducible protein OsmY